MRFGTNRNSDRRSFLKALGTTGAVITAAGAGLLKPVKTLAAKAKHDYPSDAFEIEDFDKAMKQALGTTDVQEGNVSLDAPTIAENGAVVPITMSSDLDNVTNFHLFVKNNPTPFACRYYLEDVGKAEVSCRIRMGETSDIVAVAETADGKLYSKTKEVRVTIGGCGG